MEPIGEGQIQEALQTQRRQGGLFGEILVGPGVAVRRPSLRRSILPSSIRNPLDALRSAAYKWTQWHWVGTPLRKGRSRSPHRAEAAWVRPTRAGTNLLARS